MLSASASCPGNYYIPDLLRFYFSYLANRPAQLAFGVQERALVEITRNMIDFIVKYSWKEIYRE
jgi:hypothetical protein